MASRRIDLGRPSERHHSLFESFEKEEHRPKAAIARAVGLISIDLSVVLDGLFEAIKPVEGTRKIEPTPSLVWRELRHPSHAGRSTRIFAPGRRKWMPSRLCPRQSSGLIPIAR
jgi:hypothetical protein